MSFFKFKLDNAPLRSTPVAIASSYLPSPAAPDSQLKRSASSPHLSNGPSFQNPYAHHHQQGLREGQTTTAPVPESDTTRLSLNDGRAKKRLAAEVPAVDLMFRPWSRKTAGARKSTSCFECKASKTRCEKVASGPEDACSRCLRLSKQCVFDTKLAGSASPAAAKSPAKPSAARKMKETPEMRRARKFQEPPESREPRWTRETWESKERREMREMREVRETRRESTPEKVRRIQAEASSAFAFLSGLTNQPTSRPLPSIENKQLDIKIDSLISRDVAQKVFHHFINTFVPKCPLVIFAPGTTHEYLRETKPLLFLSILSVASGVFCSLDQHKKLVLESKRALAERALVRGEKSLELVQALQVASLWYRAPDDYKQVNLTQLVHIMVTMASDRGLDKVDVSQAVSSGQEAWDRAEAQRAWLACFLLSASISLILRRPKMMGWTSDMDVYLAELQKAEVSPSDAFFCELVRTEQLCHTVDEQLLLSDGHRSASARDPVTIRTAQDFQSRIAGWNSCNLNHLQQALVDFGRFAASLYAHEPAMHVNHNVDEFEAPFASKSLKTCTFISEKIDTPQFLMLRGIVTASHGLLNCFLGLPLVDMLTLSPHIYGGRVIYSLILLCKLYTAITISTRDVTNFILVDDLHLEEYLERLVIVAKDLLIRDERNALSRSFLIVEQLRNWYHGNRYGTSSMNTTCAPSSSGRSSDCQDRLNSNRPAAGHNLPFSTILGCPPSDTESRYDWFLDDLFKIDTFN